MNNYEYGFITKCAEYGVDPEMLIKVAAPIRIVKSLPKYVATRLSKNPILKTVQQNTIDPKKSRGLFSWIANRGIKKNNTKMGDLASQYMSTNNLTGLKNVQGGKLYSKGVAGQQAAYYDDIWNRNQKFLSKKYGGDKQKYINEQMAINLGDDIAAINNTRNGLFNGIEELGLRNQRLNNIANSGLTRFGDVALNTAGIAALGGAGLYGYNQLAGNPNNDSDPVT
jgi:hypothetical protein